MVVLLSEAKVGTLSDEKSDLRDTVSEHQWIQDGHMVPKLSQYHDDIFLT